MIGISPFIGSSAGAGAGADKQALFANIRDMETFPDSNLYIADSVNNAVRVVDLATGAVSTWVTTAAPVGVTHDGSFAYTITGAGTVTQYNFAGVVQQTWAIGQTGCSTLTYALGRIYTQANVGAGGLWAGLITGTGVTNSFSAGGLNNMCQIAADTNGDLIGTWGGFGQLRIYRSTNNTSAAFTAFTGRAAYRSRGCDADATNYYLSDDQLTPGSISFGRIDKTTLVYTAMGAFVSSIGSNVVAPIAVDTTGLHLFIAGETVVQKVTIADNTMVTYAGLANTIGYVDS